MTLAREVKGREDFAEGQELAVTKHNYFIREMFQFMFDESQQMLLIHACRMMHVSIHLDTNK